MSERRSKVNLEAALDAIPIFPLPQVVLFPEAVLPLHVFEPRYRAMLADCLASHGALAIARLAPGADAHGRPRIAELSGGGVVVEHEALPDGRSNIVVVGAARVRLNELDPEDPPSRPYRVARATIVADLPVSVPDADRTALLAAASMFAAEVKKHDKTFSFRVPATADAGRVADLCAYQLVVDPGVRQAMLEELDPRERVRRVLQQIALQHGAMRRPGADTPLN